MALQDFSDLAGQLLIEQIMHGQIDCHAELVTFVLAGLAVVNCLFENLQGELFDQPGMLKHGNKIIGRDNAAYRVCPACQRFHAGNNPAAKVQLGLKREADRVFLYRSTQIT